MAKTRKRTTATKPAAKPVVSPLIIGIVVAAAILMVGGLIVLGNSGRATEAVDMSQFPTRGDADAPVIMVEYSDYG